MKTRKRVLQEEYLDLITVITDLILTYQNQGRWKEAIELEVQTIKIRKRLLRAKPLNTVTNIGNLALNI